MSARVRRGKSGLGTCSHRLRECLRSLDPESLAAVGYLCAILAGLGLVGCVIADEVSDDSPPTLQDRPSESEQSATPWGDARSAPGTFRPVCGP